jgi:hypothetical protein
MWLGLIVERTRIGREKPYVAVGVSVMVSVLMLILAGNPTRWMKQQYGQWWGVMSVVLLVGIILMVKDKMEQVRAFYGTEC